MRRCRLCALASRHDATCGFAHARWDDGQPVLAIPERVRVSKEVTGLPRDAEVFTLRFFLPAHRPDAESRMLSPAYSSVSRMGLVGGTALPCGPVHASVRWVPGRASLHWFPPQELANRMTAIVQRYVGWFHGFEVRWERGMATIGPPWVEPVVAPCACWLCRRTSDADVERRLRGFERTMWVEAASRNAMAPVPRPAETDTPEEIARRDAQWEEAAREALRKKPDEFTHWYRLRDLPHRLQRSLVTEWNHALMEEAEGNPGLRARLLGAPVDVQCAWVAYPHLAGCWGKDSLLEILGPEPVLE